VVNDTVMCGRYTKLSGEREQSEIEKLPAKEGEHIEASCSWCRRIAEDD
jgi:hypothetical protein